MAKNILVLYSEYTGYGHRSIVESLNEYFSGYPHVRVTLIDGFALGGNFGIWVSKLHSSITRNAKEVWRIIWKLTSKRPSIACEITEKAIRDNLLEALKNLHPDLILSVHPNFNGSVINILRENRIEIPFVTFIADLVDVSPLWADPRADFVLCPTGEARYKCIEFNVSPERAMCFGFPVRKRFWEALRAREDHAGSKPGKPLQFLVMSGGEGSGHMGRTARILLKNFDCRVQIIAGRNQFLRRRLERTLGEEFGTRVEVLGFVDHVQELMAGADILFSRASPNVIMEAAACNVPLVISNALPGQEQGNPHFVEKNHLGVVCTELDKLPETIRDLIGEDGRKLKAIQEAQRHFADPHVAKNIVEFLLEIEKTVQTELELIN